MLHSRLQLGLLKRKVEEHPREPLVLLPDDLDVLVDPAVRAGDLGLEELQVGHDLGQEVLHVVGGEEPALPQDDLQR